MATANQEARLDLPVKGMHCASCVNKVEAALAGVPGVLEAQVNLATERARLVVLPGQVSVADLSAAVRAAGVQPAPRSSQARRPAPVSEK